MTGYRLSPQQSQLWSRANADRRSACRVQAVIEVSADHADVESAMGTLVARHEILRTSFKPLPGMPEPGQFIRAPAPFSLPVEELSVASKDELRPRLEQALDALRTGELDFEGSALVDVRFVRADGSETDFLVITVPALCADVQSVHNLVIELCHVLEHGPDDLPEASQYADLAQWQNDLLKDEAGDAGRQFWSARRPTYADLTHVPGQARRDRREGPGSFEVLRFDLSSGVELEKLATEAGATAKGGWLTLWLMLLGKMSDGADIGTAVWFDGRSYEELHDAVGPLERPLPMTCSVDGESSFQGLLGAVSEELEQMWESQEYFTLTADDERGRAGDSLASGFEYREVPARAAGDSKLGRVETFSVSYPVDVKLSCVKTAEGIRGELYYDPSVLPPSMALHLRERFTTLCDQVVSAPAARLKELSILGPKERETILNELGVSGQVTVPEDLLHHSFERHAAGEARECVAVIAGEHRLTYAELEARADRLARRLRARGVNAGSNVLLCIDRSIEMLVGILGILKSGGAYIPIDPAYPKDRIEFIIGDAKASTVVTRQSLSEVVPSTTASTLYLDSDADATDEASADAQEATTTPDDVAYVIYTSGTTGKPKGVQITHRNVVSSTAARTAYYGDAPPVFLLLSSFAFDSSVAGLFGTLSRGGTLVLPEEGQERDVVALSKLIESNEVTELLAVPSLYAMLLTVAGPQSLDSLRNVIVAGEACPANLVAKHFAELPGAALFNEYGPTEATVWSTVYRCEANRSGTQVPIGTPVAGAKLYICDDAQELAPIGVPGEIWVGGAGVAKGYLHRDEATREKFLVDPFAPTADGRVYRTGDFGRFLPDGNVEFLGRIDHQVKIRGHRIELEEIEDALASFPEVEDAAVVVWNAAAGESPSEPRAVPSDLELLDELDQLTPDQLREVLDGIEPAS